MDSQFDGSCHACGHHECSCPSPIRIQCETRAVPLAPPGRNVLLTGILTPAGEEYFLQKVVGSWLDENY